MHFGETAFIHHHPVYFSTSSFLSSSQHVTLKRFSSDSLRHRLSATRSRQSLRIRMESDDGSLTESAFRAIEKEVREYLKNCSSDEESPLSYVALKKNGRIDLVSPIMDAGGYLEVSKRLGVPVDRKYTEVVAPTSAFDSQPQLDTGVTFNASIAIGQTLEDKLGTIEDVVRNATKGERNSSDMRVSRSATADQVPSAEELMRQNEQIVPPVVDDFLPEGERFVLTFRLRVGLVALVLATSLGFGNASAGVIDGNIVLLMQKVSEALLITHGVVAIYGAVFIARGLNRNTSLWFAKLLLGGPLGLGELRQLGSVKIL